MKVVSISKYGRELASAPFHSTTMLVGRSPSCDIVLRAKGLSPIHYLIEWVGVGAPVDGDGDGVWSVFDVSSTAKGAESQSAEVVTGEGIVLGNQPTRLGDFEFRLKEDRLQETVLDGGLLSGGLKFDGSDKAAHGSSHQLELVTIREDSGSVSHVCHRERPTTKEGRFVIFEHVPELHIEWGGARKADVNIPVTVNLSKISGAQVFEKGVELPAAALAAPIKLNAGDLLQVRWQMRNHYLRLTPRIEIPPVKYSLVSDPYYRFMVLGLFVASGAVLFLRSSRFQTVDVIKDPPRVATVEVKVEVPPVPVMAAPPPPVPQTIEQAAPAQASAVTKQPDSLAPPKAAPGLNAAAPKSAVNSVGLLGALKSKRTGTVSADRVLNDGIVSKNIAGAQGAVAIKQPPTGIVGKVNTKSGLSAAFSKTEVTDSGGGKGVGIMAAKTGVGTGEDYAKSEALDAGFDTLGGLDKESVRRTLAAYRKDFRTCYERALMLKSKIQGRVVFKWEISGEGKVVNIQQTSSTLDSPKLATCVRDVISTVGFPKAASKQSTVVIYPFEFQSKN